MGLSRSLVLCPAAPALCCAYLTGVLYYESTGGRLLQFSLLISVGLFINNNIQMGINTGRSLRSTRGAFEADARAGMPITLLADHYGSGINAILYAEPGGRERVVKEWALLRRAKYVPYKTRDDIPMKEISLSTNDFDMDGLPREKGAEVDLENPPCLNYRLEGPRWVYAIRVKCSTDYPGEGDAPFTLRASWKRSGRGGFRDSGPNSGLYFDTRPGGKTSVVWINDEIDQFRIYPDYSPFIKLHEITLLTK